MDPGAAGLAGCESLFTDLKTKKMVAERFLVRCVSIIQQSLGDGDLENAYWLTGTESPADGLTKVQNDAVPLFRLLETVRFPSFGSPLSGKLRPLRGED